ncbi:diguanylate cyclase [Aestuariibacter salexigens]|uniref:diguanylate cyclase n=1 Tax=Aestuariibacter salexigens TaxID=226010 RepID=UPI00047DB430|nr:diguanylate cyclase [Aestuariibacter salexigens]
MQQVAYSEIKNPTKYMTVTYVVSLAIIAVLSFLVHFMLDKVIAQQASSGTYINVSGQQRMLSQRSALFTIEYLKTGDAEAKRLAQATLDKLVNNHQFLLTGHYRTVESNQPSPLSDEMQAMYFHAPLNVDSKIERYAALVTAALSQNMDGQRQQTATNEFLALAKQPLLDALNTVVSQYELESSQKVDELRSAQNIVLWIIIITILVEALFIFRPMVRKVSLYAERLQYEANHDVLSGLFNRRAFTQVTQRYFAGFKRYNNALSVVVVDIDHFKRINDRYGHDVGDKAIQWIAKCIQSSSRECDYVARMGGEEFAVLLPNTKAEGAEKAAEKVRKLIAGSPLQTGGDIIDITVSAGVSAALKNDVDFDALLKRADNALYQAKESGRNKVYCL